MQKKIFGRAALCLSALFVLGDAVIILPLKDGAYYTLYTFLSASALGLILYFAVSFIYEKLILSQKNNTFKKVIEKLILIAAAVFSLFTLADTFSVFTKFISDVILKNTPFDIINIVFLSVVLYFVFKRQECILKFSFVFFVLVLILIIFFFLASITDYTPQNLSLKTSINWDIFYKSAKSFIKTTVLSPIILPLYYRFALKEKHITAHLGVIIGYFLLGLAIISPLLLFGSELSAELSYPHFSAVSTITVGRLYTRLDGFLYLVYFITSIIKISVCSFVSYSCLKRISDK